MRELVAVHFPEAAKIRVVIENLGTHTPGALYEFFAPAEARLILQKLECHCTPSPRELTQYGQIELAVQAHQLLNRRIPDGAMMTHEISAWQIGRNCG